MQKLLFLGMIAATVFADIPSCLEFHGDNSVTEKLADQAVVGWQENFDILIKKGGSCTLYNTGNFTMTYNSNQVEAKMFTYKLIDGNCVVNSTEH